jgi:hypothetical protein
MLGGHTSVRFQAGCLLLVCSIVLMCMSGCCPAGNDLSRSFKWGAEFDWRWIKGHASVYSTLKRVSGQLIVVVVLTSGTAAVAPRTEHIHRVIFCTADTAAPCTQERGVVQVASWLCV